MARAQRAPFGKTPSGKTPSGKTPGRKTSARSGATGKFAARWRLALARALAAALIGLAGADCCRGGGGPENVIVVVNARSWASQTVANHFIELRRVPTGNVFYIAWDGPANTIDAETFRQRILGPVLANIDRRGLSGQIDQIVYSSDLPFDIDLTADLRGASTLPQLSPHASLTGATYFWPLVMQHSPQLIALRANQYMRAAAGRVTAAPTHGFRSWYGWGPDGKLLEAGGGHYMLSTMLAVTSGRGNSVSEAVTCLRRSAAVDGIMPRGTIYYMLSNDARVKPRSGGFEAAVGQLRSLGVKAEIIDGLLPDHKTDVQGAMLGLADFSWSSCGSRILAGAICENLTSFGGAMAEGAPQTPLTELLRFGAAGASGTIVEPYAFQDKFPTPEIHVHYARGCCLAEAYYQSVFGPYQLLIVGDPLCKPWARAPEVTLPDFSAETPVKGVVELRPTVHLAGDSRIPAQTELFVDGRRQARAPQGEPLTLDTTTLADGYHDARVVAVASDAIETQGRTAPFHLIVANRGHRMTLASDSPETVEWEKPLVLKASAPGMAGGVFFHNGRVLGSFSGAEGQVVVDPRVLGMGPVLIEARGVSAQGGDDQVAARPLRLIVRPPSPLAPLAGVGSRSLTRGMLLKLAGGRVTPIQDTRDPNWLAAAGVKPGERYEIDATFNIPVTDVYQFQIRRQGDLKLLVDKTEVYEGEDGEEPQEAFAPVALADGTHQLRILGRAGDAVSLHIAFGGPGTTSLDGTRFRHQD